MKNPGFAGLLSWLFPIDPSLEAASHLQATCLVLGATPEAIS